MNTNPKAHVKVGPHQATRAPSRVAAEPQLCRHAPPSDDEGLKPIASAFAGVLKMARNG